MRARAPRQGRWMAIAVLLLAGGAGFSWFGTDWGGSPGSSSAIGEADIGDLPPIGEQVADASVKARLRVDLLAAVGSYRGTAVPHAFAAPAAGSRGAAPLVETQPESMPAWSGGDPPQMRVGMVLLGGLVRRAVVDGAVVGIGDRVLAGKVTAIERDGVRVIWGDRRLFYDLDTAWPREFRGELRRRTATAAPGDGHEVSAELGADPANPRQTVLPALPKINPNERERIK